jgi:thiol:disulfide interchange protein DsbD
MRAFIASLIIISLTHITYSQGDSPVSWSAKTVYVDQHEYTVEITAEIKPGWVIYAIDTPEGGPIPTEVKVIEDDNTKKIGELLQVTKAKMSFDDLFEIDVKKIANKAVFKQHINMNVAGEVKGEAYFMTCNGQQCLPPTTHHFTAKLDS